MKITLNLAMNQTKIATRTVKKKVEEAHKIVKKTGKKVQEIIDICIIKTFDLFAKIPSPKTRKAIQISANMTIFCIGLLAILA